MSFLRNAPTLAIPLLLMIPLTLVVGYLTDTSFGSIFGNLGALFILSVNMIYVVFFHSKSRWPGQTAGERFRNVMTFRR